MKPCFGYIRVSTQRQGEGVSLEAQKDAITDFASRNDLTIIQWFEEKETAAKRGRPVFDRMLKQLRQGKADGLVMHKIDRSARNLRDWTLITELPRHGVKPYFVADNLDFETRGGRLSANLQAVIAEDYIFNLREETIKGMTGRLRQGLYPFRAPIGYQDNGRGQPKTPDPRTAPFIREMFELYASRQYSLRSLQAEMKRRGLRNLRGHPLTLRGVETILNNTFYTGLITIKRTGETYAGAHKPLISSRLFKRVQEVKSGRCGAKTTKHNHLFRGLFRCGHCHGPMTPELQKGRVYYRCQKTGCPTATIREDRLEQEIYHRLEQLTLTEPAAVDLQTGWEALASSDDLQERQSSLDLRITDEETRQQRLTDLLVDGTLDPETYRERRRAGLMRLAELKEERDQAPSLEDDATHRREFLELMKSLCLLYRIADSGEKRQIVENAFSNRNVAGKNVELEPYDWLLQRDYAANVPFGDPERDKDRTVLILIDMMKGLSQDHISRRTELDQ